MPKDVPLANRVECESYGAHVTLVDGLISDCARMVAEKKEQEGWFDMSTLKEPFRVEGKKTMGYEVAEQLGWRMPQGIIYPTGERRRIDWHVESVCQGRCRMLGWIGAERHLQMIAVQAAGCAPIVKAWDDATPTSEFWSNAATLAAKHWHVPKAYGDYLILDILKKSGGVALSVTCKQDEIMDAFRQWARVERNLCRAGRRSRAGGAYRKLRVKRDFAGPDDSVVLFNTGSGLKYLDVIDSHTQPERESALASRHIGGIIGPY